MSFISMVHNFFAQMFQYFDNWFQFFTNCLSKPKLSSKSNHYLTTKIKAFFTVNNLILNSVFKSENIIIGSNVFQIIITTRVRQRGVRIREPVIDICLSVTSEERLSVKFDSFIYDSNMKRNYHFSGEKVNDVLPNPNTPIISNRSVKVGQQIRKIFPGISLIIGVIITVESEYDNQYIIKHLGHRNTFNVKQFSDLRIVCGNKEFFVSKAVLSSHSEVFHRMFANKTTEHKTNQLIIDGIDEEVCEEFLRFIYFGNSDKLEELKEDLLIIADRYQVLDLKDICENLMFIEICASNAIKLLLTFDKYNCNQTTEKAIEFIAKHLLPDIKKRATNEWNELQLGNNQLVDRIMERVDEIKEEVISDEEETDHWFNVYSFSYIN